MSAGMIGADPRVLREMAAQFDAAAQQLTGCRGSIQVWVDRRDIWRGLDNYQFTNMWDTTGAVSVTGAATAFQRCADILRRNADAQDVASAADGVGFAGSGLFGGRASSLDMAATSSSDVDEPSFLREFLDTSQEFVNLGVISRITVEDLTALLGGLGLKAGPGAALSLALAAPDLVDGLLNPDVPLGASVNSVIALGMDMAGGGLLSLGVQTKNPAVMLLGTAYISVGLAMDAASESDFSPAGLKTTWDYAKENPGVVVEEVGKATVQVFQDLGTKIGSAFISGKLRV